MSTSLAIIIFCVSLWCHNEIKANDNNITKPAKDALKETMRSVSALIPNDNPKAGVFVMGKQRTISCAKCGKKIVTRRDNQKYCSEKCRSTHYRYHHTCLNCGKQCGSTHKDRTYCSMECYQLHRGKLRENGKMIHMHDNVYKLPYIRWNGKASNVYYVKTNCGICGKSMFRSKRNNAKGGTPVCSGECKSVLLSSPDGSRKWKRGGGRGHVLVKQSDHPNADRNGYVPEHRLIMEQHLGRLLGSSELIHHINMVKDDNRIDNLDVFSSDREHFLAHGSLNMCVKELIDRGVLTYNKKTQRYDVYRN